MPPEASCMKLSRWQATAVVLIRSLQHVHLRVEASSIGALITAIEASFGDAESMKQELSAASVAVQGSGWGWLGYNTKTGLIECATRANQDPLEATTGLVPLLGVDVWEHAYYIDYKNRRPEYVSKIWDIINWDTVEKRLVAAQK